MTASYPGSLPSFTTLVDLFDDHLAAHQNDRAAEIVAIATELGTDVAGTATDLKTRLARTLSGSGNLDFATSSELTIASGAATPTQNWHTVDTEGDAASDNLDTLTATNATDGFVLFLRANHADRTVVVKHNTGNIYSANGEDLTLDETRKFIVAIYDGTLSKWLVGWMLFSNYDQVSSGEKTAGTETEMRSFSPDDIKDMVELHQTLLLPYGSYIGDGGDISANNAIPYSCTIGRSYTNVIWRQAVQVSTTNNASNYWTITLKRLSDGGTVNSFTTAAMSADTWYVNEDATFAIESLTSSDKGLYIQVSKTGSPGNLYLLSPEHEVTPV